MTEDPVLPRRVTLLGEALRPLWLDLSTRIDTPVRPVCVAPDMADFVADHLGALQRGIRRLDECVNGLMSDVVSVEGAGIAEVQRAVGRLEAWIDDLLDGQRDIRAIDAYGQDARARDLLAGTYRHSLVELRDWLGDLVETIADPMAAMRKRGLPTDSTVKLTLTLTLTSAPELEGLERWTRRDASLPFWGVVGAVALGWAVGDAMFRDDG